MTAPEYIQLKAYARQDGFFLALLWIASFSSYIMGLSNQILAMAAILMAVMSPFFVANRLKKFRDEGREGVISFGRSYAYTIFVFFYGAVLLAVAQYLYFAYMDNGYLVNSFAKMMTTDEGKMVLEQYGMTQMVDESLAEMAATRPIDYALNILTINISLGFILGVPIGLIMQRRKSD
jgi:putative flippase GtrA